MAVMPMFPLGQPVLPGSILPLHVFEPRYRQLVRDLLSDDAHPPEFGVVLIVRGREVGGGDERAAIGTSVRVVGVDVATDGRYALIGVGMERIRVNAWLPDDPYPLADVELWPDIVGPPIDVDRIDDAYRRVCEVRRAAAEVGAPIETHDDALVARISDPTTPEDERSGRIDGATGDGIDGDTADGDTADGDIPSISDDPAVAIYQLGALAPLGPADRQRLLAAPGLSQRIDVLDEALADAMAVWEFRRT